MFKKCIWKGWIIHMTHILWLIILFRLKSGFKIVGQNGRGNIIVNTSWTFIIITTQCMAWYHHLRKLPIKPRLLVKIQPLFKLRHIKLQLCHIDSVQIHSFKFQTHQISHCITWHQLHFVSGHLYLEPDLNPTMNSKLTSRLKLDSAWFRSGYFKDPERPEYVQSRPPIANQFVYREKRPRSSSDQSASSEPCSSWTDEEIWIIKSFLHSVSLLYTLTAKIMPKYKTLC